MLPTIATGNVGSALAGGYEVANSLRFDDGSSDYLQISSSSGSNTTGTFSAWIKRGNLSSTQCPIGVAVDGNNFINIQFNSSNQLNLRWYDDGSPDANYNTTAVFRDVSAWYHVVITFDTTQSTSSDRVKVYVNNTLHSLSGYPPQNNTIMFNTGSATLQVGSSGFANSFFDGYMAEVCWIDGTALDPTSFGEFDEDSSVWKPIDVSGLTFGTNGFYLDFENSGSLGADVSGNGNNFTVNNLTSVDQSTDTCTNNYCTMNPLSAGVGDTSRIPTFSEGNLKFTAPSATFSQAISTFGVDQGKWYYEVKVVSSTNLDKLRVGLWNIDKNVSSGEIQDVSSADSGVFYMNKDGGEMRLNATPTTNDYGTFVQNDIIGVANDIDNRTISIYKNGSVIVNAYSYSSGIASGIVLTPAFMGHTDTSFEINFGSPSYSITSGNSDANGYGNFEYAVPSGYYALNTKNLAEFG
jgi:hypothetical protein